MVDVKQVSKELGVRYNAFNWEMLREVPDALEEMVNDQKVRVIVFASAIEKYFSTGADLLVFDGIGQKGMQEWVSICHDLVSLMRKLPKQLLADAESDIPSSLHGLITGRLDRLDKQTKRILQEASVIGRDFLYEILKRITELEERIDGELSQLERLDLIRTRSLQPDIEYMFKHALTQEIVYNGLLKKQRREIHEQIARVIESVFKDRLAEFNDTLAYHFARGQSDTKAVDYLVKSGEKSLARYAVEEAHQYFKKAYDILALKEELSEAEKIILIDILNSWGYAYYFLGEIKEFVDLFRTHQTIAESLNDKAKTGMFYAWFGIAHYMA
jgi:DNA-binding transcriptional MerR regulator